MTPNESDGYYFAVVRFGRKVFGKNATRGPGSWAEAHFVGVAIYLITYFFGAHLLLPVVQPWARLPALLALIFLVWLLWLLLVYFNSLIVKLCWRVGLFTDLPANRVQSVLVGIVTSIFAAELMTATWWLRWIGIMWIAAVMLNLAAALLLALNNEANS